MDALDLVRRACLGMPVPLSVDSHHGDDPVAALSRKVASEPNLVVPVQEAIGRLLSEGLFASEPEALGNLLEMIAQFPLDEWQAPLRPLAQGELERYLRTDPATRHPPRVLRLALGALAACQRGESLAPDWVALLDDQDLGAIAWEALRRCSVRQALRHLGTLVVAYSRPEDAPVLGRTLEYALFDVKPTHRGWDELYGNIAIEAAVPLADALHGCPTLEHLRPVADRLRRVARPPGTQRPARPPPPPKFDRRFYAASFT